MTNKKVDNVLLNTALEYAKLNWPVFALMPKDKKPLRGSKGFKEATTDPAIIKEMWRKSPESNIGVATGDRLGMFVLDIDGDIGANSIEKWKEENAITFSSTLSQNTGGGGRQEFYLLPSDRAIRNKQSLLPNIDIRGTGGYVVLPPSIHPSGKAYQWVEPQIPVVAAPIELLELILPIKEPVVSPWKKQTQGEFLPVLPSPTMNSSMEVIERAKLYLDQCEASNQGMGGHNSLLWAAKSLVIGFELDDVTATSLLWSNFNPRCNPQWNYSKNSDRRDFERKVQEARKAPSKKPKGWLLQDMEQGTDVLQQIALGRESAQNIIAYHNLNNFDGKDKKHISFPVEHFPGSLSTYCNEVAASHVVDTSFIGLSMLIVAATAMGNAWKLKIKKGFIVPTTLWGGIVSPSGTNKSAPLREIKAPLERDILATEVGNTMTNPQGRMVVNDATIEAIVSLLGTSPRGLLSFRDELAAWIKSFNSYKKSGSDEQTWLEFWNASEYHLDRKTNNEQIRIPAASVCLLGGIQPKMLIECMDPAKFASGLVPRLLITCPKYQKRYWTEEEVNDERSKCWDETIVKLRTQEFESYDVNKLQYEPHILNLSPEAKAVYIKFYNRICRRIDRAKDDNVRAFMAKAHSTAGRLILIHRGLLLALNPDLCKKDPVGVESAKAGIAWMDWFLDEQMRVYGYTALEYAKEGIDKLIARMKIEPNQTINARTIMRHMKTQYKTADQAKQAMDSMVLSGQAIWTDAMKKDIKLTVEK